MRKKVLAGVLAAAMAISLTGCGVKKVVPEAEVQSGEQKTEQTEQGGQKTKSSQGTKEEEAKTGNGNQQILTELEKPVEIEFWHTYSDTHLEVLTKLTDDFNRSQDKVKVSLVSQPFGEYEAKVMAAAKSGTLPNIIRSQATNITTYVNQGLLTDMTPYIHSKEVGYENFEEEVIPGLGSMCSQWDGKYYALPLAMTCDVFFYNKTMFDELGIQPPKTWEELDEVAQKVSAHVGKPGFGFQIFSDAYMELLKQKGGSVVDGEKKTVDFDSSSSKELITWFKGLVDAKNARLVGDDKHFTTPLANGDVGCFVGLSGNLPYLQTAIGDKFELGAAPLPQFGDQPFVSLAEPIFSIVKSTPEEELGAWLYLNYLIDPDINAEWAVVFGGLPVTNTAAEKEVYQKFISENPVAAAVYEQKDSLGYIPAVSGFYEVKISLDKALEEIIMDIKDADTAFADAKKTAEAAMAK